MNLKETFLLFLLVESCSILALGADIHPKSNSKVSDFKAKLARTGSAPKPALLKLSNESVSEPSILDLGISVPPEYANDTVKRDHHIYYNSTFYSRPEEGRKFWIDLDKLHEIVITHDKLSDSYRQATTIELSFDFPFYGSPLRNITIATGGFLYMGDYLHNWIAATQYIAPLMANFDTRLSIHSVIRYADNGTAFTVEWDNVAIQDRQNEGTFTFQVTLLKNGDIIFAYKDVPYSVSSISDSQHPVKVGLSDAYILERAIFFVRRKTVYEYNRINSNWNISNNTALYFTALPTCNSYKDCATCLSSGPNLECNWCDAVQRCSDGIDRQRQSWVAHGCIANKATTCSVKEVTTSAEIGTFKYTEDTKSVKPSTSKPLNPNAYEAITEPDTNDVFRTNEAAHLMHEESTTKQSSISTGAVATILVFLVALVAVGLWLFYAYKYPQSSSGQFLIKYRPSQWTIKKEDTGATNARHL